MLHIARFYSVGAVCALLHNAIMIGGDRVGLHYVVSNLVSFAVVGGVGYLLHTGWTFSGTGRSGGSLLRYLLGMAANLPLSLAGMFVLVDVAQLSVEIAAPTVTVGLAAYNYFAGRWALRVANGASRRQT